MMNHSAATIIAVKAMVNQFETALAMVPADVSAGLVDEGQELNSALLEALKLNTMGMSINQVYQ